MRYSAARRAVERVVRIVGPPVNLILHAHVRLTEQNPAGRAQPSDHRRITSRYPVTMLESSAGARQASRIDPILDREGNPVQWTAYVPVAHLAIAGFGFGQGSFGT
jgi:hypothetical protein